MEKRKEPDRRLKHGEKETSNAIHSEWEQPKAECIKVVLLWMPPPLPPVYFFPLLVLLRYLLLCVLDISLHSILQEEEAAISGSSLLISSSTYVQLYSTNNTLTSEVVQKWRTNKIFIYLEKKMLTPKCIYENRRSLKFRAIFSYFIMYSYFVML